MMRKKRKLYKTKVDIELMAHEYIDLGKSSYELAEQYGVDPATIRKWMRESGFAKGRDTSSWKKTTGNGERVLMDRAAKRVMEKLEGDGDRLRLVEWEKEKMLLECTECGHVFEKAKAGYQHVFRCPRCREMELLDLESKRQRKKYEREQQLEAAREWRLSVPRVCKECGETFYSDNEAACYCSDSCRRKARNRRDYERKQRSGARAGSYRRRMRVKVTKLTYDRTVTLNAVYKKYGGKCCECGCQTVRSVEYDPHQATLDHVVALANNGTHTWDNVQLLCADCNSKKRDLGQMRLAI